MSNKPIQAPIFVYMDKLGRPKVLNFAESAEFDATGWKHIATLDPKAYVQSILDKNPKLVAAFQGSKRK